MNTSFGALPSDVRRSIIKYLSLSDVIRIGMTAKNMHDFWWPCCEEVELDDESFPGMKAHFWVLSQDMSQIRSLSITYRHHDSEENEESSEIRALVDKIGSLTKLTNLQSLTMNLSLEEMQNYANSVINNIMIALTQLQVIDGRFADVGKLFGSHSRLTQLVTHSVEEIYGLDRLTQVRNLSVSFCDRFNDQTLAEICKLQQLRSLNMYYNDSITDEGFTKMSDLTNLERLIMDHAPGIKATSFEQLSKLTKLSQLRLHYSVHGDRIECADALTIFGQLTHLTQLSIDNWNLVPYTFVDSKFDHGPLTNLTNLLALELELIRSLDFSSLTRLTKLVVRKITEFQSTIFPPNLQHLEISSLSLKSDNKMNTICSLEHLRSLQLKDVKIDAVKMSQSLKRLTALTQLIIIPSVPKDLLVELESLPNRARLVIGNIPAKTFLFD